MKEKVVFAMLIFTLVGCRDHGAPNSAATPEVATASANQGGGSDCSTNRYKLPGQRRSN